MAWHLKLGFTVVHPQGLLWGYQAQTVCEINLDCKNKKEEFVLRRKSLQVHPDKKNHNENENERLKQAIKHHWEQVGQSEVVEDNDRVPRCDFRQRLVFIWNTTVCNSNSLLGCPTRRTHLIYLFKTKSATYNYHDHVTYITVLMLRTCNRINT